MHQRHQLVRNRLVRQLLANESGCSLHTERLDVHLVNQALAHQLAQGFLQRVFPADVCVAVGSQQQDARTLQVATEVQQQRQARGIRPVQVVQQQDERAHLGDFAQERGDRPKDPQLTFLAARQVLVSTRFGEQARQLRPPLECPRLWQQGRSFQRQRQRLREREEWHGRVLLEAPSRGCARPAWRRERPPCDPGGSCRCPARPRAAPCGHGPR
jgi:hypothetical protein